MQIEQEYSPISRIMFRQASIFLPVVSPCLHLFRFLLLRQHQPPSLLVHLELTLIGLSLVQSLKSATISVDLVPA